MKRKILSGLVGVAMLGAAASANAFFFSSLSDLNGSHMAVSGLQDANNNFQIGMQLVAGDSIDIAFTGAAHDLYATGRVGMDYRGGGVGGASPDGLMDFVSLLYAGTDVFSGSVNASYTGDVPDLVTFGTASNLGGTVTTTYSGTFHNFSMLNVNGPGAGTLAMTWGFNATTKLLSMSFSETGVSGWNGFDKALYDFGNNLTSGMLTTMGLHGYAGDLYMGNTVSSVGTTASSNGNLVITAVPEPASLALLGIGIAGLGFMRRRKA